jgi:hypothetical protein
MFIEVIGLVKVGSGREVVDAMVRRGPDTRRRR